MMQRNLRRTIPMAIKMRVLYSSTNLQKKAWHSLQPRFKPNTSCLSMP